MQRHPERPRLNLVKRDGRLVGFSAPRLIGSLCRALEAVGRHEPGLAGDLARVVEASLVRRGASRPVTAEEVAVLAGEVLVSAGCEPAAHAYHAVADQRRQARSSVRIVGAGSPVTRGIPPACAPLATADPEAWSKGRIVALLAAESELSEVESAEIAAGIERALFASGLTSVSPGLLREWIDNELRLRGLPPRAGRSGCIGFAGHELRALLADGAAGGDGEGRTGSMLLERYAWAEVFPAELRRAHDEGLIALEGAAAAGRCDALTLGAWSLPALGAGTSRRAQLRALGPALRNLRHLAVREVLVLWDGPALAAETAADLLASLAEAPRTSARAARLVLCLPAERPGLGAPFLAALRLLPPVARGGARLPAVRLPAAGLSDEVLESALDLEAVDGRVQLGTSDPEPAAVTASVAVNLARAALRAGPRRIAAFLDGVEHLAGLALAALAAQEALMPADEAAVRAATGARLPPRRRLALCGLDTSAELLLGRDARGRAERAELAAALGETLSRALARGDGATRIERAEGTTRDRLGRLDLRAHPEARDRLPLAAHREGFRHDGAEVLPAGAEPEAAGREAARAARLVGLADASVVPRSTGGPAERLAYLRGYLSILSPVPDLHPCG